MHFFETSLITIDTTVTINARRYEQPLSRMTYNLQHIYHIQHTFYSSLAIDIVCVNRSK